MLKYLLHSGKNSNQKYFLKSFFLTYFVPDGLYRARREKIIGSLSTRADREYILSRVDYYCRLCTVSALQDDKGAIADFGLKGKYKSVYFFDAYEYLRYFPKRLRWNYEMGDVTTLEPVPSVVKSRPVGADNENSVLLKLVKNRHFVFLKDNKAFEEKKDKAIFRGEIYGKPHRVAFCERWFGSSTCDVGEIARGHCACEKWVVPKMTLGDHMNFKFIICLEGNDVASNLKWVMYSNSLAVMPKPTCETWFMEGQLIPDYHYVEIKSDYSDLQERMEYFMEHQDEALEIVRHAHEWCEQFLDAERERLISLLVLDKYFRMTGQDF